MTTTIIDRLSGDGQAVHPMAFEEWTRVDVTPADGPVSNRKFFKASWTNSNGDLVIGTFEVQGNAGDLPGDLTAIWPDTDLLHIRVTVEAID